ncbi:unnamed protein product [Arabidopsis thaliana]|uniref:Homeodomain-like superfamily protein n=1 Tax=Arabidopsis thaliana TaxID=3702 RepID=A0A654F8K9_ARATH|nr:unnamed protein product [Arabidopsis thaliana]
MTNLDEFLEELSSIESHSQKIVKIDEHLKKLDEETKEDEDEDAAKIIQDRSTAREAEIALLMDLRQNFLPPPSMSSSSLQPPSSSTLAPSSSSSLQPPAPLIDFFRSSVSYSHQPPSSSTLATSSSPSLQPSSMSSSSLQPPASLREFFTSSVSYSHQPSSSSTLATSSFFPSSMPYSVRPPDSSDRPSFRRHHHPLFSHPNHHHLSEHGLVTSFRHLYPPLRHRATPKAINELISEEGLTGDQIRSHLQVLRDRQKAIADKLALE